MDVVATLERLGIEGRESGDEFIAACPMHLKRTGREDSHPSWSINLSTGLFNCFSCGYRGSLFTLVMDLQGVPTVEEAKTFVVKGNLPSALARIPGPYIPVTHDSMPEYRLAAFSKAPRWAMRVRHLTAEACEHYGVLWDHREESWILPIRDPEGRLLGWQEKSQVDRRFRNFPTGVKKSSTLFGYNRFAGGQMVVVESPLDAVRLRSAGIEGAVASFGAVISKAQIMLMSAADEVVMAMDADDAGRKASRHLLQETRGVLKAVRFFSYLTEAKDVGDMDEEFIHSGIANAKSRVLGEAALP